MRAEDHDPYLARFGAAQRESHRPVDALRPVGRSDQIPQRFSEPTTTGAVNVSPNLIQVVSIKAGHGHHA
jgi:hypothetical protein